MNHLERGKDQFNQIWRYLINFVSGLVASNTIGAIPIVAVLAYSLITHKVSITNLNPTNLSSMGISHNLNLLLMMFPFFVSLIVTVILIKSLHNRSVSEVINGTGKIRWKRYIAGFGCWFILLGAYQLIDMLFLSPKNYVFQFEPVTFFILVLIALITIPVQTAYEELIFRGYLTQGIGSASGSRWLALLATSILFALMHSFNPEVKEFGFWIAMTQYITFGLAFGLMTLLDDGTELAMGAHMANNLFLCIFVTNDSSALVTSAMFKQQVISDPVKENIALIITSAIMLIGMGIYYKWDVRVMNRKVIKPGCDQLPDELQA